MIAHHQIRTTVKTADCYVVVEKLELLQPVSTELLKVTVSFD